MILEDSLVTSQFYMNYLEDFLLLFIYFLQKKYIKISYTHIFV